jgi:radical SAM protein with 4Fe4S-binding SPASM domain
MTTSDLTVRANFAEVVKASGLFDPSWYLEANPDVAAAQLDALEHFTRWGDVENRSPGPHFNSRAYLDANPDARDSGLAPFQHYLLHRSPEDRSEPATPALPDRAPHLDLDTLRVHTVFVETTTRCNLRCTYCHRTNNEYGSKNKKMPFPIFKGIIDNFDLSDPIYGGNRPAIWLHGFGEPTIHQDLSSMIAYTARSGKFSEVRMVSNLMAVDKINYDGYFAAGLTHLYVSLDSLSTDTLNLTRVGSDADQIVDALTYIATSYPEQVRVITVLNPANANEIKDIHQFLGERDIRNWVIQLMIDHENHQFGIDSAHVGQIGEVVADTTTYPNLKIFAEGHPLPKCTQPFDTLVINVLGHVAACCTYTSNDYIDFGNVRSQAIGDIYRSDGFREFRRQFKAGSAKLCQGCPMYGH